MKTSSIAAAVVFFIFSVGILTTLLGQEPRTRLGDQWLCAGYNDGYAEGWRWGIIDRDDPGSVSLHTFTQRDDYERGWNAGWYDGWGIAHRALSDIYTPPDYDHSSFKWRVDHHIL